MPFGMSSDPRPVVAIAGGTGALGARLAAALEQDFVVRRLGTSATGRDRVDLLSVPDAEVALAGARVVVFLARLSSPPARLVQANAADVDALLADSVARACRVVAPRRLVAFVCGEADERERLLASSGCPVSLVSGGGDDPLPVLERLVRADGVEAPVRLPLWRPAPPAPRPWAGGSTVLSVQRHLARPGWSALQHLRASFEGLSSELPGLSALVGDEAIEVSLAGVGLLRLRRAAGRAREGLECFEVRDGALVGDGVGHFEFRLVEPLGALFTTLRGFVPALPWLVYRALQAPLHARSMRRFGARLAVSG